MRADACCLTPAACWRGRTGGCRSSAGRRRAPGGRRRAASPAFTASPFLSVSVLGLTAQLPAAGAAGRCRCGGWRRGRGCGGGGAHSEGPRVREGLGAGRGRLRPGARTPVWRAHAPCRCALPLCPVPVCGDRSSSPCRCGSASGATSRRALSASSSSSLAASGDDTCGRQEVHCCAPGGIYLEVRPLQRIASATTRFFAGAAGNSASRSRTDGADISCASAES